MGVYRTPAPLDIRRCTSLLSNRRASQPVHRMIYSPGGLAEAIAIRIAA
jgi:hypothetical protein